LSLTEQVQQHFHLIINLLHLFPLMLDMLAMLLGLRQVSD